MSFIFIPGVLLLISFIYLNLWFLVILPWLWWTTTIGQFNIALISLWVAALLINYYSCVVVDPGAVPKGWVPEGVPDAELKVAIHEPYNPHSKKLAVYCEKCGEFKPKRAHHCRQCNKCRLKMEHHCPWINNCVGHFNHKYFVLFLFYCSIGLTHVMSLLIWRTVELFTANESDVNQLHIIFMALTLALCLPVTLGIYYLLSFQAEIIISNTTSVEKSVRKWQAFDAREANKKFVWTYDYGIIGNISAVMGDNVLLWLIPSLCEGDGIKWRELRTEKEFV